MSLTSNYLIVILIFKILKVLEQMQLLYGAFHPPIFYILDILSKPENISNRGNNKNSSVYDNCLIEVATEYIRLECAQDSSPARWVET